MTNETQPDQRESNQPTVEELDPLSVEEGLTAVLTNLPGDDVEAPEAFWCELAYESGTSGPVVNVEGMYVSDRPMCIVDPDSGQITMVGEEFLVAAVLTPLFPGDLDGDEDEDSTEDQ